MLQCGVERFGVLLIVCLIIAVCVHTQVGGGSRKSYELCVDHLSSYFRMVITVCSQPFTMDRALRPEMLQFNHENSSRVEAVLTSL